MSKPEKTMFDVFIENIRKAESWGEYPKIIGNLLRDINQYTDTHDIMLPSFLLFLNYPYSLSLYPFFLSLSLISLLNI